MQRTASRLVRQATRVAQTAGYQPLAVRAFSTTRLVFATEANLPKKGAKSKLLPAIEAEIKAEAQGEKEAPNDGRLQDLREEGIWAIDEIEGSNNISLTRAYGKETIRVTFSCQPAAPDDDFVSDTGTPAEEAEEEAAETSEVDMEDEFGDEDADAAPFEVTVTVQQQNKPTLLADILVGGTYIEIEGVRIFEAGQKVDLEALRTSEGYEGPQFSLLDPEVQAQFELYFAERGIGADLQLHIEDAKAWKEQKEYTRWLGQLKSILS